jgi:hypothetical protein
MLVSIFTPPGLKVMMNRRGAELKRLSYTVLYILFSVDELLVCLK